MLKTILIDDEKPALKALEYQLKQYENIEIVGEFTKISEAIKKIHEENMNLVFLDIEMQNINGIEAAKKIISIDRNIQIVFVTAYDDYAVDAFEIEAIDYIMKPVLKRRLDKTINRIENRFELIFQKNRERRENKILCFGNFEWINKAQAIKWRTAKTKELIAYFVHHRGRFVHKNKIIESLWEDKEIEKAVKLLHTSIYNLRKALKIIGIEKGIIYSDEMYKLNVENVYCDLYEFDKIVKEEIGFESLQIEDLKKAASLYRGDYLQENDYVWAKEHKEQLEQQYMDLMKQISRYYINQYKYNEAIFYLKKILEKDYYIEEVHKMILSIYSNLHDYVSYRQHYEEANQIFSEELGIYLNI